MNPNKALWEKGDFTEIAAFIAALGRRVRSIAFANATVAGAAFGCGDGTSALPLAKMGADVLGIDIARNLVEAGNRRAADAGLSGLKFQEGDACDLAGAFYGWRFLHRRRH